LPAPCYSHRFVYVNAPGVWKKWRVPEGKRASIRCVTGVSSTTAGAAMYAKVHGLFVVIRLFPAVESALVQELTVIAYGGELVEAYANVPGLHITVSGFLYEDPDHESFPPSGPISKDVDTDPPPPFGVPLPA
jgi:hypothetical protein